MRMRHFLLSLFLGCFLGAAPLFAQELDEIYVAEDDSFEFIYPSDWEVDDSLFEDVGFVNLVGEVGRDEVYFTFMSPTFVAVMSPDAGDVEEAADALTEIFALENIELYEVEGRELVIANYSLETSEGFAFVLEFADGGFGGVLVASEDNDNFEDEDFFALIFNIVFSFNSVGANEGSDSGEEDEREVSGSLPSELDDFDGDWEDAIAELEDAGVLASGGTLIFNENRAFFDGIGSWFTPLARNAQRRDIVMAATLEFNSDSREFESCSLMARIEGTSSGSVNVYLEVGITNDGELYWVDSLGEDFQSDVADLDLDLDDEHHILFIAQRDRLFVYVDGELVFEDVEIEERSGFFGISLVGQGANSRCEGTNVWAYDAPAFVEGLCEAVASGTVNKRSGPGTDFDRAGTMNGGERLEVIGQAEDSAGFVWYELEDDSWVREDVIGIQGDCGDIPESD